MNCQACMWFLVCPMSVGHPAARITLNSVFLHDCCEAGMDAAIVSPAKILPLIKIDEAHQQVCRIYQRFPSL